MRTLFNAKSSITEAPTSEKPAWSLENLSPYIEILLLSSVIYLQSGDIDPASEEKDSPTSDFVPMRKLFHPLRPINDSTRFQISPFTARDEITAEETGLADLSAVYPPLLWQSLVLR